MEFRNYEQYIEICEDVYNGNWTDAGKLAVDYGFFAHDLVRFYRGEELEVGVTSIRLVDMVYLVEVIAERRLTKKRSD